MEKFKETIKSEGSILKTTAENFTNEELKDAYLAGDRIYKLSAYTTIDKIDKKAANIRTHYLLVKIISALAAAMIILLLAIRYNPVTDTDEMNRIFGVKGIYESPEYIRYEKEKEEAIKASERASEYYERRGEEPPEDGDYSEIYEEDAEYNEPADNYEDNDYSDEGDY